MAGFKNILEGGSGTIGPVVLVKRYGKSFMRSKPDSYRDAKSPAQMAQRQKLKLIHNFLSPFKALLKITFASEAIGRSAYQAAQSYNMKNALVGEYPDIAINPKQTVLSKGSVALPETISIHEQKDGIQIEWDTQLYNNNASPNDTLLLIARTKDTNLGTYRFTGALREEGNYLWKLNFAEPKTQLEIWVAFRNSQETDISDSKWVTF